MKLVAFSDQHGNLSFSLPPADLYLCAGDCCPDFGPGSEWGSGMQAQWLEKKWLPWMGNRSFAATLGNHDFVSRYEVPKGIYFDRLITIDGLKVWLSPWSNTFGGWAWMKDPAELAGHYNNIPPDTDVIVSHQPPYGYGDEVPQQYLIGNREGEDAHVGSKELLHAIETVKPKLVICGHIHNGRGEYQLGDTRILNVAVVNEQYKRVYDPVEIEVAV